MDEEKNARNKELFRNLKIMETGEFYTGHMGTVPVINLTLRRKGQGRKKSEIPCNSFAGACIGLRGKNDTPDR